MQRSPRDFGKPTGLWTLELVARVGVELGWTPTQVSAETLRQTLLRLGIKGKRAKPWIPSPDAQYQLKKRPETA